MKLTEQEFNKENTVKDQVEILLDIYQSATNENRRTKPSQITVDLHYQIQADFVDALVELFEENK